MRIFGAELARRIIGGDDAGSVVFYLLGVLFFEGQYQGAGQLAEFNLFVARIACGSLYMAYLLGQILDVSVFNRLRQLPWWWVAPVASTVVGNLLDTLAFFSIAFWRSPDAFMAEHWVEIACVDYGVKLLISIGLFVPAYGVLLRYLTRKLLGSQQAPDGLSMSASIGMVFPTTQPTIPGFSEWRTPPCTPKSGTGGGM